MEQTGKSPIEQVRYKRWTELHPSTEDCRIIAVHPYEDGFMLFCGNGVFQMGKEGTIKECKFKELK